MADFLRGVSNFFGLTPTDSDDYDDERYDDFDRREQERFDGSYRSERGQYRESAARGRFEDDYDEEELAPRHSRFSAVAEEPEVFEPEHVYIKPDGDFRSKYSKAPEIGTQFRDGNIVTFDLSDLDPAEQKRYVDFVAGLVFGLRGRIKPEGSVFTLYPEGYDINQDEYDRMSG